MAEKKQVTIIIPNYNGAHFLKTCMEALQDQTCQDFETLVIDNASSDDSVELLKRDYPWAKVAVMEQNLGFSGGVNVGIRMADTPYVLLLNNDTQAAPEFVAELLKAIKKSPRIFSVSSRMVQFHNRALMDDAGDLYTLMGWAAQRGVGQEVERYEHSAAIFTACAGAALYRRKVFEKIGYFDELHFAYLEDLDVGYRARIYGYTNVYAPKAVVYHVGSGTSGSKYNSFKVKLAARNSVYVNYKNMTNWQLLINGPALAAGHLVKIAFFRKRGFGEDYVEGLKEGIRTRKKCKRVGQEAKPLTQLALEAELVRFTLVYAFEFARRKLSCNRIATNCKGNTIN
jgi:GT2 family glycosyltransferase